MNDSSNHIACFLSIHANVKRLISYIIQMIYSSYTWPNRLLHCSSAIHGMLKQWLFTFTFSFLSPFFAFSEEEGRGGGQLRKHVTRHTHTHSWKSFRAVGRPRERENIERRKRQQTKERSTNIYFYNFFFFQ